MSMMQYLSTADSVTIRASDCHELGHWRPLVAKGQYMADLLLCTCAFVFFVCPHLGYVRRRIEAKLINWPFSPLRLAS